MNSLSGILFFVSHLHRSLAYFFQQQQQRHLKRKQSSKLWRMAQVLILSSSSSSSCSSSSFSYVCVCARFLCVGRTSCCVVQSGGSRFVVSPSEFWLRHHPCLMLENNNTKKYSVIPLAANIAFFTQKLGMLVERHEEFPADMKLPWWSRDRVACVFFCVCVNLCCCRHVGLKLGMSFFRRNLPSGHAPCFASPLECLTSALSFFMITTTRRIHRRKRRTCTRWRCVRT